MIGIYQLYCKPEKKAYIGGSIRVEYRIHQHESLLTRGIHPNKKLQDAWNRWGQKSFRCMVLTQCSAKQLSQLERKWIETADSINNGYNGSSMTSRRPALSKAQIQAAAKRLIAFNKTNPNHPAKVQAVIERNKQRGWSRKQKAVHSAKIKQSWTRHPEWRKAQSKRANKQWESSQAREAQAKRATAQWQGRK